MRSVRSLVSSAVQELHFNKSKVERAYHKKKSQIQYKTKTIYSKSDVPEWAKEEPVQFQSGLHFPTFLSIVRFSSFCEFLQE